MDQEKNQAGMKAVLAWLKDLEVDEGRSHDRVTVFPVYVRASGEAAMSGERLDYVTLGEAIGAEAVEIAEQPSASVPELVLTNRGEKMVLVLDGEEIVGGKQNRIVNASFLVAARSRIALPVSCVEQGRWHDVSPRFEPGEASYFRLRREKAGQVRESLKASGRPMADQMAIWNTVAAHEAAVGGGSDTGAMHDIYRHQEETVAGYQHALPCAPGAVGIVVALNGQVAGADLFDQPKTAAILWPKLVRSYAMDALGGEMAGPVTRAEATSLLERPAGATFETYPSLALGEDVRLEGNGITGACLVYQATAVHVGLFRNQDGHRTASGGIASASLRRGFQRSRPQTGQT